MKHQQQQQLIQAVLRMQETIADEAING